MAEIYWPDLPYDFLADGLSIKPQSNVIRTTMDAGPNKARRRYTAKTVNFMGKQIFDEMEMAAFEQFYNKVIADGVLRFNFIDPITNQIAEFRFTEDYTVIAMSSGQFEVTMPLERLS